MTITVQKWRALQTTTPFTDTFVDARLHFCHALTMLSSVRQLRRHFDDGRLVNRLALAVYLCTRLNENVFCFAMRDTVTGMFALAFFRLLC